MNDGYGNVRTNNDYNKTVNDDDIRFGDYDDDDDDDDDIIYYLRKVSKIFVPHSVV